MAQDRRTGKLTVILHADVADSTGLVQRDELLAHDEFQHAFHRLGDFIKNYGGRVLELRGDALVAEFFRASDAVSAALAFQSDNNIHASANDAGLSARFRVGIALGEVVIADNTVTGAGVVLAQRIEHLADPGGISITSAIHEALPRRMPFDFENLGDQTLKGFEESVRVFKVELKPGEKIPEPQSGPELSASRLSRTTLFAVAGVLIALALGLIFIFKDDLPFEKPTSADSGEIPVIAVLPFENTSGASQDYFSDGISEDIITDLSQLSGLAVIARNSSFRFRNPTETIEEISNKLGAKYLVQGSVRRDGKQIRISAQLVDGSSGHELWANRYDRELTGMFELQDEITAKIVSELSIEISGDEQRQLDYTATRNFEAYDLFLQAQIIGVSFTKDTITEAINLYRQAIELDPEFARAYGAMAIQMTRQVYSGFADNPAQTRAQALDLALKGASLNPESPQVQWALGYVYLYRDEFDNSIAALERAVTLSPSYADGYAMLALIRNNLGQSEEAIRLIEKGMELNPFYSWDYLYNLGRAHYGLGNYQQAADYLEQALQRNATPRGTRLFLVATYVELGRQDDAEWEIVQLETTYPETTLSQLRQMLVIRDDELLQRLLGDLRTAGMLE